MTIATQDPWAKTRGRRKAGTALDLDITVPPAKGPGRPATPRDPKAALALVPEIREAHATVGASVEAGLKAAVRAGELLTAAKRNVERGGFKAWVRDNCGFKHRSATNYMKLYKLRDQLTADDSYNKAIIRLAKSQRRNIPDEDEPGGKRKKTIRIRRTISLIMLQAKRYNVKGTAEAIEAFLNALNIKVLEDKKHD